MIATTQADPCPSRLVVCLCTQVLKSSNTGLEYSVVTHWFNRLLCHNDAAMIEAHLYERGFDHFSSPCSQSFSSPGSFSLLSLIRYADLCALPSGQITVSGDGDRVFDPLVLNAYEHVVERRRMSPNIGFCVAIDHARVACSWARAHRLPGFGWLRRHGRIQDDGRSFLFQVSPVQLDVSLRANEINGGPETNIQS